jgi:tail tube protein
MAERTFQLQTAFALKKQPDLLTACQTADISRTLSYRTFAPAQLENRQSIGDAGWYGKGHDKPTFYDPVEQAFVIPSRECSLSDLAALQVAGPLFGKKTSALIFAGVYDHEFVWKNPASDGDGTDCVSTSIIEKLGGQGQYIYSGVVPNELNLAGGGSDHVRLSYSAMARKRAVNATSFPTLSSVSFMKFVRVTAIFCASATSPETEVSTNLVEFNMSFKQNPQWWLLPGGSEADQNLYNKVSVGRQALSGNLKMFIDSTRAALFDNNTECKLELTCQGAVITGAYRRQVRIEIPHFHITSAPISGDRDMMMMDFNFNEESVLKVGSEEPVKFIVRTSIDDTEILVAST